ncbi:aminotransferase class IV family protein [Loktanella sp. S4079]|uniref:aminotransferase class IV family protein n=1 Tax=Loktanella sp. S4079 TaxID=579483 RepID=UPI0005FA67D8|nr:aminotransferase class IV family protein [Loktanella sp. S4079]KJZ19651.1 4-amino-4-deoxychorismate lyase [Loktanella sp. S4079]
MESALRIPLGTKLIETFGWVPGQGYVRLDPHLRRMERSARDLGFAFDRKSVATELAEFQADAEMRCRLTLAADGSIEVTRAPMPAAKGPWVVQIAKARLDSSDPWLRHKTTNRALYDEARATMPEGVDELIFLNERDEVCEGTITNIFVKTQDGKSLTPPLSSGLLPGIYREYQLEHGLCQEAVLTLDDLRQAKAITLGNSLRGKIAVDYQGPLAR